MLECFSLHCRRSESDEATLRILRVSAEDSGVYTCVATNAAGSVSSSASLTVSGQRPASQICTVLLEIKLTWLKGNQFS